MARAVVCGSGITLGCGGQTEPYEECDDGNLVWGDGCGLCLREIPVP